MIPAAVRQFAEEPDRHLADPAPPSRRLQDDRFVLFLGPTRHLNFVSSVRVDDAGVAELVSEIRELAVPERRRVAWVVGPSCRPEYLSDHLVTLGFVPAEEPPFEPLVTAMTLTSAPTIGETEAVEVRCVETFDDYVTADEITSSGFGLDDEERAAFAATARERFAAHQTRDDYVRFLAFVDGTPVAAASANASRAGLFLGGAATLPGARGQGAYRVLVRARWDEAVRRDTPALVIQAGAMSRPILERVGFETVCELSVLIDPATAS